ncbi:hypothetical protein [Bosea sp. BK604]|uniref:hypothetical protein n=1 Tax=Bosea sp. BK604 TaxID=2512180 RepID=UPI00104BE776|nr:hypothetical protein [Bosea sp. BK604]TCR69759.1 hypothetical protein EV560_101157 [Bosea sp. BK604]
MQDSAAVAEAETETAADDGHDVLERKGKESDFLLQASDVTDYEHAGLTADTRMRIGYPRMHAHGTTESDPAVAKRIIVGATRGYVKARPGFDNQDLAQEPTKGTQPEKKEDKEEAARLADVKRALAFKPGTGVSFISDARFDVYLKNNLESRIADGAAIFQAVDFGEDGKSAPKLSYLRVGKPEKRLKDNGTDLTREQDLLMDQKYEPGIGMFTDAEVNLWSKGDFNIHTGKTYSLIADEKAEEIVGENYSATYEYSDEKDAERVKKGEIKPQQANREIISVSMKRKGTAGWYEQEYKRAQSLDFSVANKGEVGLNASYGVSIGAKMEHSLALSLGSSISGKMEMSKGFEVEVGEHGAVFKGSAGAWTQDENHKISASNSIKLGINEIDTAPMKIAIGTFKVAFYASVAAQTGGFAAYASALRIMSGMELEAGSADQEASKADDANGLKTALDKGMELYEAAVLLSAISGACGCAMAAAQALWMRGRVADPTAPSIKLTRSGIQLSYGASSITIDGQGVNIDGPLVTTTANQITNNAPAINNNAAGGGMLIGGLFD